MELKDAIKKILKDAKEQDWDEKGGVKCIWVALADRSEDYGVDEEWLGVSEKGELIWAYASDCSCWDGDHESKHIKTIKTFEFKNETAPAKWIEAIKEFSKTREQQSL